jgi:hypothetical protein
MGWQRKELNKKRKKVKVSMKKKQSWKNSRHVELLLQAIKAEIILTSAAICMLNFLL